MMIWRLQPFSFLLNSPAQNKSPHGEKVAPPPDKAEEPDYVEPVAHENRVDGGAG